MKTSIHDVKTARPEIKASEDGRGWLSFYLKRQGWLHDEKLETVEVTMFSEDVKTLVADLSEALREELAQIAEDEAKRAEGEMVTRVSEDTKAAEA